MSYHSIQYAVDDRVATITLNRPDRLNAIAPEAEKRVRLPEA